MFVLLDGCYCLARRDTGQSAHALGDALLRDDLEKAGLAGVGQVSASAKLAAETIADFYHAYDVPILVAKEGAYARQLACLGDRQLPRLHGKVVVDFFIYQSFDLV